MKPSSALSLVRDPLTLAEARALVADLAEQQARAFEVALSDLVEQAEEIAKSDSQPVGVREIARQVVTANRTHALNLQALINRSPK